MSIKEASSIWKVSPRRIQIYCSQGRIEGVSKSGIMWLIPSKAKKPEDGRITTGAYKNWRKKEDKNEKNI
ncbi:MAG: DNA-binding protein [Erysipelotrichaceae bacterium]|nr:DNA-binding protein [Erysipelotrichaceae bacterium]